jgi:ElaB/YqjD/DUF883 family membrane-anchored ribosome-binding protein
MKNHTAESSERIQEAASDLKSHARLTGVAAMDMGRATYQHLQNKAVTAAQKTDRAVRGNPYVAVGLSFGAGLILGAFLSRPKARTKTKADEEE